MGVHCTEEFIGECSAFFCACFLSVVSYLHQQKRWYLCTEVMQQGTIVASHS